MPDAPKPPVLDAVEIERLREGFTAHRLCGVCMGFSPSWDGHDVNPPCWGHVVEMIPHLLDHIVSLESILAVYDGALTSIENGEYATTGRQFGQGMAHAARVIRKEVRT